MNVLKTGLRFRQFLHGHPFRIMSLSANSLGAVASMAKWLDGVSCSILQDSLHAIQRGRPPNWLERAALSSIESWGEWTRLGSSLAMPLLRATDTQVGLDYEMRWHEFANKIQIYNAVKRVERTLELQAASGASLDAMLLRAEAVDPFTRGWAFEGIGYYYASSRLTSEGGEGLLKSNSALAKWPEAAPMVHAGMGMALAEDLLKRLRSRRITDIDRGLDEFEQRCVERAAVGYAGAALEPLGLMVRTYYRDLFVPIAERLRRRSGRLNEFFWHGIGRGMYFALEYFPPCCGLTLARAAREAAEDIEVQNLIAGLAWAITLVNLREPDVIKAVVARHGGEIPYPEAFAAGVTSSLLIAYDTAPHVDFMALFCDHHATGCQLSPAGCLPQRLVQDPCSIADSLNRKGIREAIPLGEVFRYHELSWFAREIIAPRS